MTNSRVKNTLLSTFTNIAEQIITIVFGFIVPRLVIKTFGSEINGLTAFITQFLNLFQLLQCGTVGASIYALYKPIATNDYEKINEIVDASKKFFFKIGVVFSFLCLLLIPVICFLQKDSSFKTWELIIVTIIMGINAALSFFFDARYDIVISSYQKRYVLSLARIINKLTYYILFFLVVIIKSHFVFLYASSLAGKCVSIIILHHYYCVYSKDWRKPILSNEYKIDNRGYLLSIQISFQLVMALPYIIVSTFYDLVQTSVYSINYMIMNVLYLLVSAFCMSVTEPLANYKNTHSEEEFYSVFYMIFYFIILIISIFAGCFICLDTPFIKLYMSDVNVELYAKPLFAYTLVVSFIFMTIYLILNLCVDMYGLFKEIHLYTVISLVISFLIFIIIGKTLSIEYIPLGLACYYSIIDFSYICIIKNKTSILKVQKFLLSIITLFSTTGIILLLKKTINYECDTFIEWILCGVFVFVFAFTVEFIQLIIIDRKTILSACKYMYKKINNVLEKK